MISAFSYRDKRRDIGLCLQDTWDRTVCIENVEVTLRSKLFPALEEVLGCHLCGLKELVQHHREFDCNVLKSSTISVHTQSVIGIYSKA